MNPHLTQTPNDGFGQAISRMFVATIVPVFGVFVLRLILASLPMIRNAGTIADLGLTPMVLMKAILDTVIYFLIGRFCMAVSVQLKIYRPHLAEIATIILLAGAALIAILAYSGYEGLFASLAPTQMELYNWLFLMVALAPIAVIVVIVTRRLDFFTNLLFGKLTQVTAQPQAFAAAYGSPTQPVAGFAQTPPPPAGPAPVLDPAAETRARLLATAERVTLARQTADRLQQGGQISPELAECLTKMQGYLDGARLSLDRQGWTEAKSYADWADYEASRIMSSMK